MKFASAILVAIALTACGGGGESTTVIQSTPTPSTQTTVPAPEPVVAFETPALQLAQDAPNSNLDLAPGGTFSATTQETRCGHPVPGKSITGVVTSVHDGDTIKIGSTSIRLDGIDAPELTQAYGTQSRDNLARLVNGKVVTVYYSKLDKYGRTVGSVFTSDCVYVNLAQLQAGAAWHYKQYQCEQAAEVRSIFAHAQDAAGSIDTGLWAGTAVAPWVYRNGTDPVEPTCKSSNPSWYVAPATTPVITPVVTPVTTPTPNSCFRVWVNGYRRANGTYVSGYYRKSPGCP